MRPLPVVVCAAMLAACMFLVDANININDEINRIEEHFGKMQSPHELIETILQQIKNHCKSNRTIDQSVFNKTGTCVQQYFNETKLINEIKEAVPQGKLDTVFHDMCLKWPNVKNCFEDFIKVIDDCWQKGDQVIKFVDNFIRFFCGDDNDGVRIALFFAEGGMKCLEEHGDQLKTCIEGNRTIPDDLDNFQPVIPQQEEICKELHNMHECTISGLQKCTDPTPENLITSMLKQVGKALECKIVDPVRASSSVNLHFGMSTTVLSMILFYTFASFWTT